MSHPTTSRRRVMMLMDWYSADVHKGIAEYAASRGWMLNAHMAQWRSLPRGWEGDGVIASLNVGSEHLAFVQRLGLPTVDIGLHYPGLFPGVAADNATVGRLTAEHFLERGHRHIVFLFFQNSLVEEERFQGFSEALRRAGREPQARYFRRENIESILDYARVFEWTVGMLKTLPKPCALACAGDYLASLILDAYLESGVRVPEEVMLVGAGNDPLICEFAAVPLTSVDTRQREVGRVCAKLLDQLMGGEPVPRMPVRIPPAGLVERQSTRFRAVFEPMVRDVLGYIWRNFERKLTIDEVVAQAPVSRATLYQAFEAELGMTLAEAISEVRLREVCKLLRETALPIQEIARRCGYSGPVVFHNAFQRAKGVGPKEWRKLHAAPERDLASV